MAHASPEELQEYMGTEEPPEDAERLLERASELVDQLILAENDVEKYGDTLRDATCAQVEWWVETGDELGVSSSMRSISLGSFSADLGRNQQQGGLPAIAPRARRVLSRAGLLYRGVRMR